MRGLRIMLTSVLSVAIVVANAASEQDTPSRLYRTLTGKKEQAKLRALLPLRQNPEQCAEALDHLIAAVTTIAAEPAENQAGALAESTVILIQLIGSIDNPYAIETLITLLDAKRMEIAMVSAEVLGQINCRAALSALQQQTQRPEFATNYGFRFGLFRAVAQIEDPDTVEFLSKRLPTLNGQLAHEVHKFLDRITVAHFRGDRADFDAWKNRQSQRMESATDDFSASEYRRPKYEQPNYYGIGIHAKRLVFVIDHSGSMGEIVYGESRLVRAKRELIRAIRSLPETTDFAIVLFDSDVRQWRKSLVEASDRNKKAAIRYVAQIRRGKWTNTYGGLKRALGLDDDIEAVFLLSDGKPTRGTFVAPEQIIREIGKQNTFLHIIINTVGISPAGVSQRFMRELASQSGGEYQGVE